MTVSEFHARRKGYTNAYFPVTGATRTVLVSSYVWWTEQIAHAFIQAGCNVLVAEPWYLFWLDDRRFVNFDAVFRQWVETIRKFKVQLVIGGNTTCIVPHVKTKELLHNAAGVPLVNWWWDEPRSFGPILKRGAITPHEYLNAIRDPRTLNAFWDADVEEEMRRFLAVSNTAHVPLGATPDFWTTANVPLAQRPGDLCFLGNNHDEGGWIETSDPLVVEWAEKVVGVKIANLDRPMVQCIEQVGGPGERRGSTIRRPYELAANLKDEFDRWNILGGMLLLKLRNTAVRAAAERLGERFELIGKGWDRMGLKASREHSGVPGAKDFYAGSKASMNLFGGCVHGGMPLRPYEICSANGLLFTQYNRELPSLFDPAKECVAFRTPAELGEQLDRILTHPRDFDAVVEAGRARVAAEHTWLKRVTRILDLAKERFNLQW